MSLIGAWQFQLQQRTGSGSIFAEGSNSNLLLDAWLYYDAVLLVGGVAATVVGLAVRRLRAPAVAATLLALVAMRPGGYLPAMYVVQVLPFLAILLVGVGEVCVSFILGRSRSSRPVADTVAADTVARGCGSVRVGCGGPRSWS